MPIYAYKCSSCGFAKDVLQKISDAPLTQCPECGAEAFSKQLTAPGFQLKGTGWYATDFKNGGSNTNANTNAGGSKPAAPAADSSAAATTTTTTTTTTAAPAPAPAAASSGSEA